MVSVRPPLQRIMTIDHAIRSSTLCSSATLSKALEVNWRTIQRDIEFMRDQLHAPIEYTRKRGYYYSEESYKLAFFQVTAGEMLALFVAEKLLKQLQGTPFADAMQQAFQKLASMLPEKVSIDLSKVQDALSVTPTVLTLQDVETFNIISTALHQQQRIEIDYFTAARNTRGRRLIDPYHLTLIDGDWQIVAWCHQRKDIRMFAMHRVKAARLTEETFERPAGFKIQDYMKGAFRAVRGGKVHQVELLFISEVAARVQEKIWHPSQKLTVQKDGSVRLQVEVNSFLEIRRWILWWGKDCTVINPSELKAEIIAELGNNLAHYGKNKKAH